MSSSGPVFVAGCGRSGTSYVRTILDAHPDIFIPSESLFLVDYLRLGDALSVPLRSWLLYREPQLLCWYSGPRHRVEDIPAAIARTHEHEAALHGATRWGQKTPRFVRHRALFDASFPGIRWILVHRDPRAVVLSMLRSGQHTSSVWHACERWNRDNRPVIDALAREDGAAGPSSTLVLRYEDLVRDYDRTIDRLFRFVGVEPIGRAAVERGARPVFFSRSRFAINTVRGGMVPDEAALDRWRRELTRSQLARIEAHCAEGMAALGYERVTSVQPGRPRAQPSERLRDVAIVARYLVKWPEYPLHTLLRKAVMHAGHLACRLRARRKSGLPGRAR